MMQSFSRKETVKVSQIKKIPIAMVNIFIIYMLGEKEMLAQMLGLPFYLFKYRNRTQMASTMSATLTHILSEAFSHTHTTMSMFYVFF